MANLRIFRLPRKIVFLGIGGLVLLGGATGAFALYGGAEILLPQPSQSLNGLECTDVQSFDIRKKDRLWVRKFIRTESTDGMTRVRTALRVANAVYEAQKPDLVQVVVLDENGPNVRSEMRGRAVGADVVFVPDPEKLAGIIETDRYAAKYADGSANEAGQFFGTRVDVPLDEIDHLVALLKDRSDCAPAAGEIAVPTKKAGGHKALERPYDPAATAEAQTAGAPKSH
ncbi:hypothetical protein MRS76_00520 [Rhizobiaceae bacterium n13]|uniref:Uncharacterized protein n=1 Tax=Ferirhizobium litorale TaxID=2927786 RepID=A0AAE3Q950_9HYPH|nr:hypothetical protein [Fererhizobium litorale]MDI7860425.1 hypothetical protein [Fererhizobium litorale]MDI7920560.1 hypothetical protein [Fererhizobium litorale]